MCFPSTDMTAQVPLSENGTSLCDSVVCCYISKHGAIVFTVFTVTKCLLSFPPCTSVLYLALQRWWQQHSTSNTAVASPSDVLTYNVVLMTLLGVSGSLAVCLGIYVVDFSAVVMGLHSCSLAWYGEILFHILICLERYFSVVHPIMYLKLKHGRGIFIRNTSIVCVWLLCILKTVWIESNSIITVVFDHIFVIGIASFCSLSVLCILVRPIPGRQRRDGNDRAKQRASIIIMSSLWILCLRICWNLILLIFIIAPELLHCVVVYIGMWVTSLSSLVTPLMFLHRAGKLEFCKKAK